MEPRSQAIEVIRRAEGELRQLLLCTAEQGDYETARLLAEFAKQLKQMLQQNGSVDRKPRPIEVANGQALTDDEPKAFAPTINNRTNTGRTKTRRPAQTKKVKTAKGEYPKFMRDSEELLKIGWSKRERKVYRHKAPKSVVLLVSQALQQAGQDGDRFVMGEILPIRDRENDTDVPSYQAYLSLAWLRKEKLIVQHGRQGYSLHPEINLPDAVEERWKLLPRS
jgi:hypothetical protein